MMNLIASTYGPSTSADCLLGKFAIAYDKVISTVQFFIPPVLGR